MSLAPLPSTIREDSPEKASSSKTQKEMGVQHDLQKAADLYRKGLEITHRATSYDDQVRAIEMFSLAISVSTAQARFFLARGNCFRAIGNFQCAANDYSQAITIDDKTPAYYANRAACRRKLNDYVGALEDMTAAVDLDMKKGQHFLTRGLLFADIGFLQEAIIDLTKALEESAAEEGGNGRSSAGSGLGPRLESRALQTRGTCFRKIGNMSKCIDDLQKAIQLDTSNPAAYASLGQAYLATKNYDDAIVQYTEAIHLNSSIASYFTHLGLCYFHKGDSFAHQALDEFDHAIQLNCKPYVRFYRGAVHIVLALDLLKTAEQKQAPSVSTSNAEHTDQKNETAPDRLSSHPKRPSFRTTAIKAPREYEAAMEHLNTAYADFKTAWGLAPKQADYQVGMAIASQLLQKYEEASAILQRVIDSEKHENVNLVALYHSALCAHLLNDRERALTLLSDAIDAHPDEALFYFSRGLILQEMAQHELAITDYTIAIDLHTDAPIATWYFLRADSLLRLGKYQEAVEGCTRAIAIDPHTEIGVYNTRGMGYRALGEHLLAIEDLTVCLKAHPKSDVFHYHRGLTYMDARQSSNALLDFKAVLATRTSDGRILYYVGINHFREQEYDNCLRYLRLSFDNGPPEEHLSEMYYTMGLSLAITNRNEEAVEYFTHALDHLLESTLSSEALQVTYMHERAKAQQLSKRYREAIQDFTYVIRHSPKNAHAYFRRGFAYKSLGDLLRAASDLQTAKRLDPENKSLAVEYKTIRPVDCIVLCRPGEEKEF